MKKVERWDVFEVRVPGISEGNPFTERKITGTFQGPHESVTTDGFYDGNGVYAVRFMPSFEGEYHYVIEGNYGGQRVEGTFFVTPPRGRNHGPVHVANQYHFAYADGTPYYSIGTTCYVWDLQRKIPRCPAREALYGSTAEGLPLRMHRPLIAALMILCYDADIRTACRRHDLTDPVRILITIGKQISIRKGGRYEVLYL